MVGVLLVFSILSMLDRQILTMLVVPVQKDLALSDLQIGMVLGPALAIANAAVTFPFGWAADRWSRRWIIFIGSMFWSVGCAASAFADSFEHLFLARSLVSIGEASLAPCAYSLIADRFPRGQLMTALSVYGVAPKIGISIAFAAGGAAVALANRMEATQVSWISDLQPWRLVLLLVSVPGAVLSLLAFTFREPRATKAAVAEPEITHAEVMEFVRDNRMLLLQIVSGFCFMGICSGAINTWAPTFVTRQFGLTAAEYGWPMSVISLLGAAAIIPKGAIIDWLFRRGMTDAHIAFFTWMQTGGLFLILYAFLSHDATAFFVLYGCVNIVVLSFTLYLSAVLQLVAPPRMRGRLTGGALTAVALVTLLIGPTSVGAVTDLIFRDPQRLGWSICATAGSTLLISIALLRAARPRLRAFALRASSQGFRA